jgi:hypothetical protein
MSLPSRSIARGWQLYNTDSVAFAASTKARLHLILANVEGARIGGILRRRVLAYDRNRTADDNSDAIMPRFSAGDLSIVLS